MDIKFSIYGIAIAFVILIPLAWKWKIDIYISVLSALVIGFISSLIVNGLQIFLPINIFIRLLGQVIFIIGTSSILLLYRFYRDPDRKPLYRDNVILSPADGKIIYIKKTANGEVPFSEKGGERYLLSAFFQSDSLPMEGTLIGIAMNFLDVHVNRSPIGGKIDLINHIDGEFLSLGRPEAVVKNERQFTIINSGNFSIGMVQIASRLVRNIVSYKSEGEIVDIGDRIGMIRFGSQVDLFIPDIPMLRVNVNQDQLVKAGLSVIAEY